MKQITQEKNIYNSDSAFDDRSLPSGKVDIEQSEAIEQIILPEIEVELEKLRKIKPHLFRSSNPK